MTENNITKNPKLELLGLFYDKVDEFQRRNMVSEKTQFQLQATIDFMIHEEYVNSTFGKERQVNIFENEVKMMATQAKNVPIQGKTGCVMKGIVICKRVLEKYIDFVISKNQVAELKKSDDHQFLVVIEEINKIIEKLL